MPMIVRHSNAATTGTEGFQSVRKTDFNGWVLHEYSIAGSTNLIAASLAPWNAVRADVQTAGRGRFQRSWVSNEGGLWLSAVVPAGSAKSTLLPLPLIAGLAVCNVIRELGVGDVRMRWPNDILVQDRKVAGLLIDQFTPGSAVVGIGINLYNSINRSEPALQHAARLADFLEAPPSVSDFTQLILRELRDKVEAAQSFGFARLLPEINALWSGPRCVELDLDGHLCRGLFTCVNEQGSLLLADDSGRTTAYAAHEVRHLEEIL